MIGFPFDSHVTYNSDGTAVYDRAITSAPYRKLLKKLFTTGVDPTVSTAFQVSAGDDLTVIVSAGFAIVEGCMKLEENNRTLALQAADTTYDRIDTVVLRLDTNDDVRACDLYVVEGTAASSPVHPDLTRSNSIYELGLADVFIPSNATTIQDYRITDTRLDSSRCGVLTSISEFDTTTLYKQIQSDLTNFQETEEADFSTWSVAQKAAFVSWVASIKDILDEETAGHLQNEIGDLTTLTTSTQTDLVSAINEIDASTLKAEEDESTDTDTPTIDADKLGGLYVAADITEMKEDISTLNNNLTELSTTEKAIGKDEDGNTVYRKTIVMDSSSYSSSSPRRIYLFNDILTGISKLIKIDGVFKYATTDGATRQSILGATQMLADGTVGLSDWTNVSDNTLVSQLFVHTSFFIDTTKTVSLNITVDYTKA